MATWDLYEEGYHYDTVEAASADEALERAKANVHRANYPDIEGSMWIDVRVECEESGETASGTVRLDEPEPEVSSSKSYVSTAGANARPTRGRNASAPDTRPSIISPGNTWTTSRAAKSSAV